MAKPAASEVRQPSSQQALARTAAALPAVLAALFGLVILYGVGIAQPTTLHNAAHDSRHAISFPCH